MVEFRFFVLFLCNKRSVNKKEDGLPGEGRLRDGLFRSELELMIQAEVNLADAVLELGCM